MMVLLLVMVTTFMTYVEILAVVVVIVVDLVVILVIIVGFVIAMVIIDLVVTMIIVDLIVIVMVVIVMVVIVMVISRLYVDRIGHRVIVHIRITRDIHARRIGQRRHRIFRQHTANGNHRQGLVCLQRISARISRFNHRRTGYVAHTKPPILTMDLDMREPDRDDSLEGDRSWIRDGTSIALIGDCQEEGNFITNFILITLQTTTNNLQVRRINRSLRC